VKREKTSPFFEIALVFVRFDHVASIMVNANHVITVHSNWSLRCGAQKAQNPAREVLGNNRLQSQQSRLELGLRLSD
jgi:hypothetical protein